MKQITLHWRFFLTCFILLNLFLLSFPQPVTSFDDAENVKLTHFQIRKENIIYITGFPPFLNYSENPSEIIVNNLHNTTFQDYRIIGRILPVDFIQAPLIIQEDIFDLNPSLILCLGLDATCTALTIECIATNLQFNGSAEHPVQTLQKVQKHGPFLIPTGLQVKQMYSSLNQKQIPVSISFSAGIYVCNTVFYQTMYYLSEYKINIPAGFIHLPFLAEENEIGLDYNTMITGIQTMIQSNLYG